MRPDRKAVVDEFLARHRGREAVAGYFRLRRELAGGRTDLGVWRAAGVYRVIAEAWLVPLDQEHVEDVRVAEAGSRYVCLDAESGEPAALPDGVARGWSGFAS